MRTLLGLPLLLLVFAAGCGAPRPVGDAARAIPASTAITAALDSTFALRRGASTVVDGQRIRFDAVVEDSRCPEDVSCVWEGRATVSLSVFGAGRIDEVRLMIPGFVGVEDAPRGDQSATYGNHTITMLALDPYPSESTARNAPPVATLRISRVEE